MSRAAATGFLAVLLASSGLGAPKGYGAPSPALADVRGEKAGSAQRRASVVDVLGVRPGMSEVEAQRRLGSSGTRREIENEEAESAGVERELWTLRGSHFRYVVLGVEGKRVVAVQAFARPECRTLRYRDLGDLDQAKKLGFYIYEWMKPGTEGEPGVRIQARGTDPEYLASYSIVRDRTPARKPAPMHDAAGAGPPSGP